MDGVKKKEMSILGHDKEIQLLREFADRRELPHGYVFWGAEGAGKQLVGMSLAGYLENGLFEPPKLLQDGLVIGPDPQESGIGIDAVRSIRHFLWQRPARSARRIVIVNDAHLLTPEAQNAFLKIAEEPPEFGLLILVLPDPELLQPTLLSRFQKLFFSAVPVPAVRDWLVAVHRVPAREAAECAQKSFGRPGLAYRIACDEKFGQLLSAAQDLLEAHEGAARTRRIREILDDETASFPALVDALILLASWRGARSAGRGFWHELLALRHNLSYLNLNPRIQLTSVLSQYGK